MSDNFFQIQYQFDGIFLRSHLKLSSPIILQMLVALSRTTRSGRVSRPPRHMATNKIADETIPTPYQSVSSQPKPEPKTFAFLPGIQYLSLIVGW